MRYTTLPLALLLLVVAGHAGAQAPPAKAAPAKTPAPLTLAQALAKLPPPAKGVLLAVGADKVTLSDGALPPAADASLTVLANTFGDITQDFGSVTAIAPGTYVLLNPDPASSEAAQMDPVTAFKILAASLNDTQWKAFTSEGGLGLPDLTDDIQRNLFRALFPDGQLWVASQDSAQAKLPDNQRTDTRNVSAQIDGVRVRLGQRAEMYISDKKGNPIFFALPATSTAPPHTWQPKDPAATENNVPQRAVVPNAPKSSGLLLSDAKFQPRISLAGPKTVGELVARVAVKTHTELYADPHYASRTLTAIGPASEVPASDVLRALALDVAGTYRQVGPAFVLTNDLEGVGTLRRRLFNWSHGSGYESQKLQDETILRLRSRRAGQMRSLSGFGDPLAMTADQMKSVKDIRDAPGIPDVQQDFSYAKLTPAQQNRERQIADAYEDYQATKPDSGNEDKVPQEPNPTGPMLFSPGYKVQMLVPTVSEPVETSIRGDLFSLFTPSNATPDPIVVQEEKAAAAKLPPAPPLLPLLQSRPRRAVVGHPTTPAAVDALIAAMQKIGLNELWLDVFSEGKSHLMDKDGTGRDILTEALAKTKGAGITVYADLSLLSWGYHPPKDTWDLDILGQNSHFFVDYDAEGLRYPLVPPPVSASPVSATVQKTLRDMVRSLASREGLAGFVWEDAIEGRGLTYTPVGDMGYTPAMRLAFLRAFHADPIDIIDTWYNKDLNLPNFEDQAAEDALTKQWADARLGANALLLTELRQAIPASANKPILMERQDNSTHWLVTWDDPHQMPPPLRTLFQGAYPRTKQVATEAAKQGRSALVRVTVKDATDTDALARDLEKALPPPPANANAAWDGYVLDFDDVQVTDGTNPLRDVVRAAGP